jgi:hypothetical protein
MHVQDSLQTSAMYLLKSVYINDRCEARTMNNILSLLSAVDKRIKDSSIGCANGKHWCLRSLRCTCKSRIASTKVGPKIKGD